MGERVSCSTAGGVIKRIKSDWSLQVTTQMKPSSGISYWRNGRINQALVVSSLTWETLYLFTDLALIPGIHEG